MADLTIDSPRPDGFVVLKQWCAWVTSPDISEGAKEGDFVTNATVFKMLVDFQRAGVSIAQRRVEADYSVVGADQSIWNTQMHTAYSLTTAQIAAMPEVVALIVKAAKEL